MQKPAPREHPCDQVQDGEGKALYEGDAIGDRAGREVACGKVEGDVEDGVVIGLELGRHDVVLVVDEDPKRIEEVVIHQVPVHVLTPVERDQAVEEGKGDQCRHRQPHRPPADCRLPARRDSADHGMSQRSSEPASIRIASLAHEAVGCELALRLIWRTASAAITGDKVIPEDHAMFSPVPTSAELQELQACQTFRTISRLACGRSRGLSSTSGARISTSATAISG